MTGKRTLRQLVVRLSVEGPLGLSRWETIVVDSLTSPVSDNQQWRDAVARLANDMANQLEFEFDT